MGHPGSVVSSLDLAQFVLTHFVEGLLVGGRIVLDGNLRCHSTHGVNAAAVTGLNQQVHVGLKEMLVHGHNGAVGENEVWAIPKLLDETENVVPAAAVEAGGVVAELVKDFVHLEGRENSLDEDGGADGAARD